MQNCFEKYIPDWSPMRLNLKNTWIRLFQITSLEPIENYIQIILIFFITLDNNLYIISELSMSLFKSLLPAE